MATRPTQGGSVGTWGTELNAWIDEVLVYRKVSEVTVGAGGSANISFTVPSGSDHLRLTWKVHTNGASFDMDTVLARLNGDTVNGNYKTQQWYGRGTDALPALFAASASGGSPTTAFSPTQKTLSNAYSWSALAVGYAPSGTVVDANAFGWGEIAIPEYLSTVGYHGFWSKGGAWLTDTDMVAWNNFGVWKKTPIEAITQIVLLPANGTLFNQNSMAALYVA